MVTISIKHNFPDVKREIDAIGKQARYAAAVALTRSAQDSQKELRNEMRRIFDRPTPFTLNSLYLKRATRDNLESQVWLKDDFGTRDHYLLPNIYGGSRPRKSMERTLQAVGLMAPHTFAVPAAGAKLDRNGNVLRSQIVQLLSQLRAQRVGGFESRATGSKRSNRAIKKQGVEYFALAKAHGKLRPGIYARTRFAFGSAVRPVFLFVDSVNYKDRFKFFEVGQTTGLRAFPGHFERELAQALRTARPTQGSLF
ncbi:MAG: hypothetical protein KIS62_01320 [Ramlibacter sp.]|nr:hypothetical protein [Ramlibacter sp.]